MSHPLAWLDDVPPALRRVVITDPVGAAPQRAAAVASLRAHLLEGALPPALAWPEPALAAPLLSALAQLDLPRWCAGEPALTERVLETALQTLDADRQGEAERVSAALEALLAPPGDGPTEEGPADAPPPKVAEPPIAQRVRQTWAAAVDAWDQTQATLQPLQDALAPGFDLTRGTLRDLGWEALPALQAMLAQAPQLHALVRALGRARRGRGPQPTLAEQITRPMQRAAPAWAPRPTPRAPIDTRGVTRGADLARLLPAQAAWLAHPRLRLLWHARRAERGLLQYLAVGTAPARTTRPGSQPTQRRPADRPERGPVLVCLDTSGSMRGAPEALAKALTLEALRLAQAERRACVVYSFSGPGDLLQHRLALTPAGWPALLRFLGHSFHGGTDVEGAVEAALAHLGEPTFAKADLLLITDGRFPLSADLIAHADRARALHGVRVHGVLIGGHARAMDRLCDHVHRLSAWIAPGGDLC